VRGRRAAAARRARARGRTGLALPPGRGRGPRRSRRHDDRRGRQARPRERGLRMSTTFTREVPTPVAAPEEPETPWYKKEYFIAVVRSAELTGQLDDALDQLAGYLERELTAGRQLRSSLTYPIIVLCLAVVAVIVMSFFVLPQFKDFYKGLGAKLPLPTRMLL